MKIKLIYPVNDPEKTEIISDIIPEKIPEMLSEVLRSQIGAGSDDSPANQKDVYTVIMDIDLTDDTIRISSDTNNKSLTTGIIADVLAKGRWSKTSEPEKKGLKILILEDDLARMRQFKENTIGHVTSIVSKVSECIDMLRDAGPWDMLFLDHDLDGKVFVPSGPGTGWEVAEWLNRNPDKKPAKMIIHTLNSTGALKMKELLPEAELLQFAWAVVW